ncbi:MAG: hemolysin III family protein [Microbacteriaceae bacterium]|nr:hemolysin III family protein [Microbacteriaceae bacterium]
MTLIQDAPSPEHAAPGAPADEVKPTWRGWIHAGTFPVAIALGVVLVCLADGVFAKLMAGVFFASTLLLFGGSALYHRFNWSPKVKQVFRRIDHANIFLLIAGTYTPIATLGLPMPKSVVLISIVWGVALLGIAFRVFWVTAPRWLYVPLYLGLGWAALMYVADFFTWIPVSMILVFVGGAFYTAGAIVYGLKRPNPSPRHFGFHEIFHAGTLLAFLCHWTAVFLIAVWPPTFG